MQPPAHKLPTPEEIERRRRIYAGVEQLFANLDLILENEKVILRCDAYSFCRVEAAHYGVYSNGYMNLGTLIRGWRSGILIDKCRNILGPRKGKYSCGQKSYVYSFGGLLSGTGWSGYCKSCGCTPMVWDGEKTFERLQFASTRNKKYPAQERIVEEFEVEQIGAVFKPREKQTRRREVIRKLVYAVSVEQLISELTSGETHDWRRAR